MNKASINSSNVHSFISFPLAFGIPGSGHWSGHKLTVDELWTFASIIIFAICFLWLYRINAFDRVRDVIRALNKKAVDKDSAQMREILSKIYCVSCGKNGASFLRFEEKYGQRFVIGKCFHCGKENEERY